MRSCCLNIMTTFNLARRRLCCFLPQSSSVFKFLVEADHCEGSAPSSSSSTLVVLGNALVRPWANCRVKLQVLSYDYFIHLVYCHLFCSHLTLWDDGWFESLLPRQHQTSSAVAYSLTTLTRLSEQRLHHHGYQTERLLSSLPLHRDGGDDDSKQTSPISSLLLLLAS